MKISYEWLRKYVPTKIRAKHLAEKLTIAGLEVVSIENKQGDYIFDIETTPNRPDTLSHIGIAREVSAIAKKPVTIPRIEKIKYALRNTGAVDICIKNKNLCNRYTARTIIDVCVGPSPKWLVDLLMSLGLRPVNNIVDITNFVLHETGQPLHAFDLDKIKGGKIIVRAAAKQEKIITIDGVERTLDTTDLVIADSEKPIAIAGVMGGQNTEITEKTKRILIESALFDPLSIRRTSKKLNLISDSSYRFERGLDSNGIIYASDRATSLICATTKARAQKRIIDVGKKKKDLCLLKLNTKEIERILGVRVNTAQAKEALHFLGFKSRILGSSLEVTVPSFRPDIQREIDLIEEVARVYGYDKIPTILPKSDITTTAEYQKKKIETNKITKNLLSGYGFSEIITYSLISSQDIKSANMPETNLIALKNPLTEQQETMRNSLIPGMLKAIKHNINAGADSIKLFEISNIYFENSRTFQEKQNMCIGLCGQGRDDWSGNTKTQNLFYLKGIVSSILEKFFINISFEQSPHPAFNQNAALAVMGGNIMYGALGKVREDVLTATGIKKNIYIAEIDFESIKETAILEKPFQPFSRYPKAERDISFLVDIDTPFKNIESVIRSTAPSIIKDIVLVELYQGKQIPKDKKSLLIRVVYQSKEKTLEDKEIEQAYSKIKDNLIEALQITIR